ncbi:hypothetical protein YSY43_00850 [Paenibacillus sp. YSY-4.3]
MGHLKKRIVFLGDSITENGGYIRYLEAYFLENPPQGDLEFINLGVGGEMVAGMSEPGLEEPRPWLFERLDRALEESSPDWVFICYGMNDGIYYSYREDIYEAYCSGIRKAVDRVRETGARVILMTPPPFDLSSVPAERTPLGEGAEVYGYDTPYEGYNDVLGRFAQYIRQFGGESGYTVVDLRDAVMSYIQSRREEDPDYIYGDAVHPEDDGHWVMAKAILHSVFHVELEHTPEWAASNEGEFIRLLTERRYLLSTAWREHVGHSNAYKAETPPLKEALRIAEQMTVKLDELCHIRK